MQSKGISSRRYYFGLPKYWRIDTLTGRHGRKTTGRKAADGQRQAAIQFEQRVFEDRQGRGETAQIEPVGIRRFIDPFRRSSGNGDPGS